MRMITLSCERCIWMSPKRLKRRHWYNITFVVQISHHSNRQGCSITMTFQNREVDIVSGKLLYIYRQYITEKSPKDTWKHGCGMPEEGWLVISEACMLAKWSDLMFFSGGKFGDTPLIGRTCFGKSRGQPWRQCAAHHHRSSSSSSSSSSSPQTPFSLLLIITWLAGTTTLYLWFLLRHRTSRGYDSFGAQKGWECVWRQVTGWRKRPSITRHASGTQGEHIDQLNWVVSKAYISYK